MKEPLSTRSGRDLRSSEARWVLIVEDNSDDERLARRAFKESHQEQKVVVAHDGVEALEVLRSNPAPVLVLLDIKLPRLSGVEVLMAIKDDARLRTVPVVVLTSSTELSDIGACYELGCNAYVEKPVEFDVFIAKLGATLEFWLNINLTFPE